MKIVAYVLILTSVYVKSQIGPNTCSQSQANLIGGRCPADIQSGAPCTILCKRTPVIGRSACARARHCCFFNSTCMLREPTNPPSFPMKKQEKTSADFYRNATGSEAGGRSINLGSSLTAQQIQQSFPTFTVTEKFPHVCLSSFSLGHFQPQINIPYCQRIACQPSNIFLEVDDKGCLAVPGCAYDYELSYYRQVLSQGILPGVPTCHLAIRNEAFHKHARTYINQSGFPWNPYLTKCLIDFYAKDIFNPSSPGCSLVLPLSELGYLPKRAGWKSISEQDCYLINGCWVKEACYYPFRTPNLKVKSTFNDKPNFDFTPHGKPACQLYNNSLKNGDFLNAYHNCLASGCQMTTDKEGFLQHVYGVAISYLPLLLQHQYWTMAILGEVRADNWKKVADRLIRENRNNKFLNKIFPSSQTAFDSASPISGGISLLPFSMAINITTGSVLEGPLTTYGSFGQFGSSNSFSSGTDNAGSRQLTGNSNRNPNLNIRGITSKAYQRPASESAWRNLQNLLAGKPPPSKDGSRSLGFPCLFQPFNWPNFPPLRGSFEGCCDQPLCYIPSSQLHSQVFSEVTSYVTWWTSWTPCSVTCGTGNQMRRRVCVGNLCSDKQEEETKSCGLLPACPISVYTPWSEFSKCSKSCGEGSKTRTRRCLGPGSCTGRSSETVPCETGKCAVVRHGRWSPCSVSCGVGIQVRVSICIRPGANGCPPSKREQRPCEQFCGQIRNLETCDATSCYVVVTPTCLTDNYQIGHCRRTRNPHTTRRKCSGFHGSCCVVNYGINPKPCSNTSN